jgi:hypothetical protein
MGTLRKFDNAKGPSEDLAMGTTELDNTDEEGVLKEELAQSQKKGELRVSLNDLLVLALRGQRLKS